MSELFPDRQEWLAALEIARKRASVPAAPVEPPIATPRPRPARTVPKIEQSTTHNPQGESPVKTETEIVGVRGVAQLDPVEARVDRLRQLNEHMVNRYLDLAVALHAEHISALWTQAVAPGGGKYLDEESFWENLGVKRRTAYQLISVGAVLAQVSETAGEPTTPAIQAEASEILLPVGLAKLDVVVPVLRKSPVLPALRKWADLAKTHSRDALRELVAKALGRKLRDPEAPGERFKKFILNQVPPDARIIAEEFFEIGERVVESENAIAILLAGMAECLSTWAAHSKVVAAEVDEPAA